MKIALSSAGFSEYSLLSPSLGKCPNFLIYDTETKSYECFENKARLEDKSNGPKAIRNLVSNGVDHLITYHIGRNAFNEAKLSGLPVFMSPQGEVVNNALKKYFNNELKELNIFDELETH